MTSADTNLYKNQSSSRRLEALNIAWCITGGGAGIRDTAKLIKRICEEFGVNITLFFTQWGFEVARIFGVLDILRSVATGEHYREFLVGVEGMFYIGRLNMGRYSLLVVAPATANSVAKMVLGIADNIASALYSQALKSGVPVIVMPTDYPGEDGFVETETPCYIDRGLCDLARCSRCLAEEVCPVNAIKRVGRSMRIDLSKCIGCERCVYACPFGSVRCWEKVRLRVRAVDFMNIDRLRSEPNTVVVRGVEELREKVYEFIQRLQGTS